MTETRTSKVREILDRNNLHACIFKSMDNIFYLTGFRGTEGTALVTRGDVILIVDGRYVTYAKDVAKGCIVVETKGKDMGLTDLIERYGIGRLGFDSAHTVYQTYSGWKDKLPAVEFVPLGDDVEMIRQCKEREEMLAIRKALDVATNAFNSIVGNIKTGMTEKSIAAELDYAMQRFGAEHPSFDTIVASGHRSALPHGRPSDKAISPGEAVIVDFGAQVDGYCSDETVTLTVGKADDEILKICTVVRDAQQKGIAIVRSGTPVQDVDAVVRGYIEEQGYGQFFKHGTGHGVGIAVHEAPSVTVKSDGLLEEGMVITIEPGIYLPGLGGARLEEMVLVTETGAEVLTRLRKDLIQV
jgi:Xaa-Pro aminopeptidase